jgi:hypothetical protein
MTISSANIACSAARMCADAILPRPFVHLSAECEIQDDVQQPLRSLSCLYSEHRTPIIKITSLNMLVADTILLIKFGIFCLPSFVLPWVI